MDSKKIPAAAESGIGSANEYEPIVLEIARPGERLKRWRACVDQWVHIRNLASKALATAARQIQSDWLKEYCYAPVLLETFVDLNISKGRVTKRRIGCFWVKHRGVGGWIA